MLEERVKKEMPSLHPILPLLVQWEEFLGLGAEPGVAVTALVIYHLDTWTGNAVTTAEDGFATMKVVEA